MARVEVSDLIEKRKVCHFPLRCAHCGQDLSASYSMRVRVLVDVLREAHVERGMVAMGKVRDDYEGEEDRVICAICNACGHPVAEGGIS